MAAAPPDAPEHDRLLGHADEADGIEEYDNKLPTWWVWLFYATIAFGAWYVVDWHVLNDRSQTTAYDEFVAWARETWTPIVPAAVVLDDAAQARGAALYATNCVACHAADATGGTGPNLLDSEWIHGGTPDQINHTIFYGVQGKGMIGWGPLLGPEAVADIASYVHQLGGGEPLPPEAP